MNIEVFVLPVFKTHKEQSEFCRARLSEICEKYYGYTYTDEQIEKNAHGKPCFKDNVGIHFNISHTKGMGVVVVDERPCGVDIEAVKSVKLSMAERFFASDEVKWIKEATGEEEEKRRFFIIWTGKEAYTKMLGCGLTMKMSSFSVLDDDIKKLLKYREIDGYIVCVCSQNEK